MQVGLKIWKINHNNLKEVQLVWSSSHFLVLENLSLTKVRDLSEITQKTMIQRGAIINKEEDNDSSDTSKE